MQSSCLSDLLLCAHHPTGNAASGIVTGKPYDKRQTDVYGPRLRSTWNILPHKSSHQRTGGINSTKLILAFDNGSAAFRPIRKTVLHVKNITVIQCSTTLLILNACFAMGDVGPIIINHRPLDLIINVK